MHSFSEYLYTSSPETQISKFFEIAGPVLEARLTLENFEFELNAVSKFEESLPDSLNMHIDMILTGGAAMVSQYYQELTGGKAKIVERLRTKLGEEKFQKVNEALADLRTHLKEKNLSLNEQDALDFQKKIDGVMTDAAIDAAASGVLETKPKSGILGTIKTLWNSLTDNGDPISILQLVLDLCGLIPGTWGVAADLVNALIYALRKKPLLAVISLVSAIFPYVGDSIKALKLGKAAKYADDFFQYLVVKHPTAANAAAYLERIPIASRNPVMKLLRMVGDKIVSAVAKGSSILASFTKTVAKYTSAFPKVEKFFENLTSGFEKFGARMGKVADDLKLLPATPLTSSTKVFADLTAALSPTLGKVGGKLTLDEARGIIRLTNAEGKIVREFSEELLTDPRLWINNPSVQGFLSIGGKSTKEILKHFNSLSKIAPPVISAGSKALSLIHKGFRAKVALLSFFGKQLFKMATGKDAAELGVPEEQLEFYGSDFLNRANQKKIDELKAQGVKYPTGWFYDASNEEDYKTVTKYQNDWAKLVGGPEIIPLLYDKYGDPKLTQEYNDFWKKVKAGEPIDQEEEKKEDQPLGKGEVAKKNKDFWKSVAKGEITRDETGQIVQGQPAQTTNLLQVPDLTKTNWYKEVFPQESNESLKVLSFDQFTKQIK